jgi:metal-responsive CopG/Arc/MetJ family transcriptional regulator
MRKDRISVALTKDLINKLNEESRKTQRSRSNLIQVILERNLNPSAFSKQEEEALPTTG